MRIAKKIIGRLEEFVTALETSDRPISEQFNCRTVVLDLEPTVYNPQKVADTRRLLGASQVVFAQFLGVSVATVRAWERGGNSPSDMAARFMDEIRRNPAYWQQRLRESVKIRQPGKRRVGSGSGR